MHGPYTFSKRERLQRGHEFRRVYELGRKVGGSLAVLYVLEAPPAGASGPISVLPERSATRRVGIVASRRVGGAVRRNRAKRLLREAFRLQQHRLKENIELVLVARSALAGRSLPEAAVAVERLFAAAGVLVT